MPRRSAPAAGGPQLNDPVHYVAYGSKGGEFPSVCRAATIADVGAWVDTTVTEHPTGHTRTVIQQWAAERCALMVANPAGLFFHAADHDAGTADTTGGQPFGPGTWHTAVECRNPGQ